MKIALVSDVHLEFGDLDFENTHNADVLILGGDICVANDIVQRDPYNTMGEEYRSNRFHAFFDLIAMLDEVGRVKTRQSVPVVVFNHKDSLCFQMMRSDSMRSTFSVRR
jgi:hypothetical protein